MVVLKAEKRNQEKLENKGEEKTESNFMDVPKT